MEFEFGHLHLPNFPLPEGMTDEQYLRKLCEEKISNRYSEITEEIQQRLEYELSIIHRMGYDSYFLIVWIFINFARSPEHRCRAGARLGGRQYRGVYSGHYRYRPFKIQSAL